MRNIKFVLTERFYAWEDARKLALTDREVTVDLDNANFNYEPFEEQDIVYEEGWEDGERFMEREEGPTKGPYR
jgi:hypothetical protein